MTKVFIAVLIICFFVVIINLFKWAVSLLKHNLPHNPISRRNYGWFQYTDNASVYCETEKDWTNHKLIGKPNGGKFKCMECGKETPARIVN